MCIKLCSENLKGIDHLGGLLGERKHGNGFSASKKGREFLD